MLSYGHICSTSNAFTLPSNSVIAAYTNSDVSYSFIKLYNYNSVRSRRKPGDGSVCGALWGILSKICKQPKKW